MADRLKRTNSAETLGTPPQEAHQVAPAAARVAALLAPAGRDPHPARVPGPALLEAEVALKDASLANLLINREYHTVLRNGISIVISPNFLVNSFLYILKPVL